MGYVFPSELEQLVQEKIKTGSYKSEDEVLLDAMHALNELQRRHAQLRDEIQTRAAKCGQGLSVPFDPDEIKALARAQFAQG
jgi:putative addiction module CopG family antidote